MVERATLGNLGLGILLAALAGWLWHLHVDGASWVAPEASRVWTSIAVMSAWLGLTGLIWHVRHRRAASASDARADALLIAYASQTGFADALARQTAQSLEQAGVAARCVELGRLSEADLREAGRVLFVVSTTGEGDAPDSAARFAQQVMPSPCELHGVRYGLLALGDRDYDDFCGFGHRLHHWLVQSGAQPLFDPVDVDNGDDGALRHWQHHLGVLSGAAELPDWQRPAYQRWTLRERRLLNAGSLGGPCYHLALVPPESTTWQAGDIAEIEPRHGLATVQQWLGDAGLDGARRVGDESLAERLARSHLPSLPLVSMDLDALVASLQDLPHREYSLASLPSDGEAHLLVRQMRRGDGELGLGSGWLTRDAVVGESVAMRIRSNPNFHAPTRDVPMILIGNGTGLAGLRALLKAREARGHRRNWLVFGERQAGCDFFHGDDIQRWQREGLVQRLDLAWSRDANDGRYVQQCLRDAADELRRWVDDGAAIYVCGSLAGMAPGVDAVLREVLGEGTVEQLRLDGRYRRDVY